MKYLSLFSGIGAFESALRNLEIPFDLERSDEKMSFATRLKQVMEEREVKPVELAAMIGKGKSSNNQFLLSRIVLSNYIQALYTLSLNK